jgi:hypothetical protein
VKGEERKEEGKGLFAGCRQEVVLRWDHYLSQACWSAPVVLDNTKAEAVFVGDCGSCSDAQHVSINGTPRSLAMALGT